MPKTKPQNLTPRFWEHKTLEELTPDEWEALCDCCGQCCLFKLEDEDSGELYLTNVICRFLDRFTGRCRVYIHRHQAVPTCIQLNPRNVVELRWIPPTCAYRLVAQGKPLPDWHPLISGKNIGTSKMEFLLGTRVVSEADVDKEELKSHIISTI